MADAGALARAANRIVKLTAAGAIRWRRVSRRGPGWRIAFEARHRGRALRLTDIAPSPEEGEDWRLCVYDEMGLVFMFPKENNSGIALLRSIGSGLPDVEEFVMSILRAG